MGSVACLRKLMWRGSVLYEDSIHLLTQIHELAIGRGVLDKVRQSLGSRVETLLHKSLEVVAFQEDMAHCLGSLSYTGAEISSR